MKHRYTNKSAQSVQDRIFRRMSADKKLKLGAGMWRFAHDINKENKNGQIRSKVSFKNNSKNTG